MPYQWFNFAEYLTVNCMICSKGFIVPFAYVHGFGPGILKLNENLGDIQHFLRAMKYCDHLGDQLVVVLDTEDKIDQAALCSDCLRNNITQLEAIMKQILPDWSA